VRWRGLATPTVAVVLGVLAITSLAAGEVRRQVADQKDQVLQQRSTEVALTLTVGLGEVRSALDTLGNLPVAAGPSAALFDQVAGPLLTGNVRLLAWIEAGPPGGPVAVAAVGDGLAAGAPLDGARADLVERAAAATDVVSALLVEGDETRVGFALPADDQPGSPVVVREIAVDPSVTVEEVRDQAFGNVDVFLYAGGSPDPDALVLRTASRPEGDTFSQELAVGADTWLLVTQSRGELVSTFADLAPWASLVAGLVVAALLGGLVEALSRRRRYAEALVSARTAELEATLAERSRFEAEARRAGAAADEANRSKSEFLARMSHELRTPLNAVLGFTQLLEMEPLTPTQRESVDQVSRGGRHLLDLINEVLDITRIETGNLALSPEPVDAAEVVDEVVQLLGAVAERHRITVLGDIGTAGDVHVFADRQRLKQILLNLVANAIKYNRVGGTVSVRCTVERSDRLRINVTDTGPGIAAEHLDRLFAPFERLGAEQSDIPGTGIGLALSRRLAEAMDGAVDVDTTLGRGSTFWVELPIVEGQVERFDRLDGRTPIGSRPAAGAPAASILYIEDNLSNLRLVQRLLERRGGIELISTMQGRLGIDLARQHQPLAVLLDLHLPDMDGEDVLAELRADPTTASIPVYLLSAEASPGRVQRLLAAGARAYLTKPLDVRRLLEEIDRLVDEAAP
jgi:signal transduction histidine kinase/ActR/RegA family two-component response regulator